MSFDSLTMPWEVFVIAAIVLAMLLVFSLVRWIFLPRAIKGKFPVKRLLLFVGCMGLVLYAYRFVDNFPAKFQTGLNTNVASTSDTPAFPELRTPRYAKNRTDVFEAATRAIQAQRGWKVVNMADSGSSLQAEVSVLLGVFTDDFLVSLVEEGGNTRVDVQSRSLKGGLDLGANRRHIVQFLMALESQLGVAPVQ